MSTHLHTTLFALHPQCDLIYKTLFMIFSLSHPSFFSLSFLFLSSSCYVFSFSPNPVTPLSAITPSPSPPPTRTTAMPCSGTSNNSEGCQCTSFAPKKSKKSRCKDCGHRQSHHSDPPTTESHQATPDPRPTLDGGQKKYVDRLLQQMEVTAIHEEARKETLLGYRPMASVSKI